MALLKGKLQDIPPDAVILSEHDAMMYQLKILKEWKNSSDVWAVNYGGSILATLGALSGIYFNNYYRFKFRLLHYGQIATYLPVCVIPAATCFVVHGQFVLPDIVLQKSCAVCTELRASALQATVGCIFPALLAPIVSISLALRYSTYDVPYITEPMKTFQFWKKQTRPIRNILFAIFVGQALAASTVTYFEAKSVERVNDKLTLLGYDLNGQDNLS